MALITAITIYTQKKKCLQIMQVNFKVQPVQAQLLIESYTIMQHKENKFNQTGNEQLEKL